MIDIISFCFAIGLGLAAIAGAAIFAAAALPPLRHASLSSVEGLAQLLSRAAASGNAIGEKIGQPRARGRSL